MQYIPDSWNGDKRTERNYFWAVLTTICPEYVTHIITTVEKQREQMKL
jgi:hypothetical protein